MPQLKELETAVMFWAGGDPDQTLGTLKRLGVRCGQMGVHGDLDLSGAASWKKALQAADFTVTSVVVAFTGEDYADVPTVARTVGYIPPATRAEREKRTYEVSQFAAAIGAQGITTHLGFVPDDTSHPDYGAIRDLTRRICDYAAKQHQTFGLETGQETAAAMLDFVRDVDRKNLGINFDPANMILYGTGDPIEALGVLGQRVISVHCKDGDWPPKGKPDALGVERPLGAGAVGMDRFLKQLKKIGYKGTLAIEREGTTPAQWLVDVEGGIKLLENLKQTVGN